MAYLNVETLNNTPLFHQAPWFNAVFHDVISGHVTEPLPKPEGYLDKPSKIIQNVHQIGRGDSGWPVVFLR